ncbi:MAG: hypothetical protein ACE5G8_00140 [Anaerolineae bacterium]
MINRQLAQLTSTKRLPLWIGLAALAGLIYLGAAQFGAGANGFPLDDAWIHQTYARNLGLRGEFAFTPGLPSAGSTAPLWSALLGVGYFLRVPFKLWTHGLGILFLGLSGFSMARLGQTLFANRPWLGPLIGLSVVAEWHLIWAAVSGMETGLFVWLTIFLLERYAATQIAPRPRALLQLGLVGGLLALVRPEGVGLLGLVGLDMCLPAIAARRRPLGRTAARLAALGAGALLPLMPYLAFNLSTSGLLLPNTFYAKQHEYAILLSQVNPLQRWLGVVGVTLIGGQVLLLPGLAVGLARAVKERHPLLLIIAGWWLGYLTLYAFRLPVTYQHGRYQMPTLPWLLLLGIWGTANLLRSKPRSMWARVASKALAVSIVAAMLLFVSVGARGYANDVQFIETEMVAVAHWLAQNTPPQTVIAAHDIGAIGYFTQRPLVDLAGLVTPDVIPFIRDEAALLAFARARGAAYLVTFPRWYPAISASLPQVYSTNSPWAIAAKYDNIAVYNITHNGHIER